MARYIFMIVILPLIVILELCLAFQVGIASQDARTLVAYVAIVNAIPFLIAHVVFSAYLIWTRASEAGHIFQAFIVIQILASLAYVVWISWGSKIDKGFMILWGCYLLPEIAAFGISWGCWLTYRSLSETRED